jgi:uncharacterized protein YbjT (DUF2867 family)
MVSPILVTGGTGTSGRHVVRRLREAGRDIRVLSRHQHASGDGIECVTGDLLRGEGIESAVAGNEKGDEEATGNLVGAGVACRGVALCVHLGHWRGSDSNSQRDRPLDVQLFRVKAWAERIMANSGLPWTTLRAAQFHDFILADLRARGKRRMMVPLWIPGKAARAFRAGANLNPDRAMGQRTWADFLAARVGSRGDSR